MKKTRRSYLNILIRTMNRVMSEHLAMCGSPLTKIKDLSVDAVAHTTLCKLEYNLLNATHCFWKNRF